MDELRAARRRAGRSQTRRPLADARAARLLLLYGRGRADADPRIRLIDLDDLYAA